jgi:hypothetical protein
VFFAALPDDFRSAELQLPEAILVLLHIISWFFLANYNNNGVWNSSLKAKLLFCQRVPQLSPLNGSFTATSGWHNRVHEVAGGDGIYIARVTECLTLWFGSGYSSGGCLGWLGRVSHFWVGVFWFSGLVQWGGKVLKVKNICRKVAWQLFFHGFPWQFVDSCA